MRAAKDHILWISEEADQKYGAANMAASTGHQFFHVCRFCAVSAHTALREALDPMALGICRYCKEALM